MKKILIVLWIATTAFAQYEKYNANFGTTTSISCQIVDGAIFVNGRLKRRMNSRDVAMLADYNVKVQKWKQELIDTIIKAVPFHIELGHPSGLQDWPFGPRNNPFESTSIRKRRAIGRFPDTPAFCNENNNCKWDITADDEGPPFHFVGIVLFIPKCQKTSTSSQEQSSSHTLQVFPCVVYKQSFSSVAERRLSPIICEVAYQY